MIYHLCCHLNLLRVIPLLETVFHSAVKLWHRDDMTDGCIYFLCPEKEYATGRETAYPEGNPGQYNDRRST